MASPALDKGTGSEVGAVDLTEFRLVQPDLRAAVDLIAVIKHEAAFIGVAEVLEVRDFDLITRLSHIKIINQLFLIVEKDEIGPGFLLDRGQFLQEIMLFLTGAPSDIRGLIDEPCDPGPGTELLPKFIKTDPGGMGKISPPVIVGNLLELLPLDQRRASGNDDILFLKVLLGTEDTRESEREKQDQRQAALCNGTMHALLILQSHNAFNLNIKAKQLCSDSSAGRGMISAEILCVDVIHFLEGFG